MIENLYFYNNDEYANELDCVWTHVAGAQRRMLLARATGAGVRVADCYVAVGGDAVAAMQAFQDILILRGRWHGPK